MLCLGRKSKRSRISDEVYSPMFVSESNIFNPQALRLCIINSEGVDWYLEITPDFLLEKLKVMALGHFLNPIESIKVAAQYKLVLVSTSRVLNDDSTVQQENVKENDELLLLPKRKSILPNIEPSEDRDQLSKGPSEAAIIEITANTTPQNTTKPLDDGNAIVDFQTELRKILISLVDASQKILCKNPDILPIFKAMHEKIEEKSLTDIDPSLLRQLTDMGFPESKAIKALQLNKMSPVEAMEWLLEQNIEPENSAIGKQSPTITDDHGSISTDDTILQQPSPSKVTPTRGKILYTVAEILETFKAYKRKGFRPNLRALLNLKEMGFAEEEVIDALRINGNNQDAACEWLLGDRHPTLQDMGKGLDPDGPIYKAIISNPIVQLGLNNPKTFLAFLHMLENPNTANHWLNDPDTAPLLSQIFRIYHAEKHSLQLQSSSLNTS